ncbi:MAG TPA: glutamate-5-semialdehyde dehydrogenase, partial [Bacteroidales bacterium]|nr:glutamate-5-semialdehyde dehydrogenase [Bacteroidales bacterium]
MEELEIKGQKARKAANFLIRVSTGDKNNVLNHAADLLEKHAADILEANKKDLADAEENGVKGALLDRLTLNEDRIGGMADGLRQIAQLDDPVGEVLTMKKRPNGLVIGQKRVPMGVIGIIYEARPNVTADAFGLCLKTGNATILRGGKEAIHSNMATINILQNALADSGFPAEAVQLVENTTRESAVAMMKLNKYLDLLIPRGGAGLIKTVVENSSVPVIETGVGNCHVFVDESADPEMGTSITVNSKIHRPGVCNAAETLLIHRKIADTFVPEVCQALKENGVELRGDETVKKLFPEAIPATEEDWATEYLDYIMAVKVVDDLEDAMRHIDKYGTKHTEVIVT